MKRENILSVLAYSAAVMAGSNYLYLLLILFAFLFRNSWIPIIKNISFKNVLKWGGIGGIIAILIQIFWVQLQKLLGIFIESTRTSDLIDISNNSFKMTFLIVMIAPILEEFIFRKIIFEFLNRKMNITSAAVISSLVFSLYHFDFANTISYFLMGMTFSTIYILSKNLFNSMVAHMVMNAIVLILM
ncbi:lysostaphin resistance A-like protein [Neobacillus sp. SM06]|uniref:CPBP family intramembrane glutamic endopeptidase n=1 Tax=Neobacillus sp. SM06 TaxID=3422492 RepID=UPI003D29249F